MMLLLGYDVTVASPSACPLQEPIISLMMAVKISTPMLVYVSSIASLSCCKVGAKSPLHHWSFNVIVKGLT